MSSRRHFAALAAAVLSASALGTAGDPIVSEVFRAAGVSVYPDHERSDVFYLEPPPARIAIDEQGRPDLGLTLTYYVGTSLRDDTGSQDVSWALRVGLEREAVADVAAVTGELQRRLTDGREAALRRMPLRAVPTSVEYAPIDTPGERVRLGNAHASESSDGAHQPSAPRADLAYWTRRSLSFALEAADGAALRAAFEAGGALMSVSYAYLAAGVERVESAPGGMEPSESAWRKTERVIAPDALRVSVDVKRHPDFLRVVDLNSLAPPGYPGITVICSDFAVGTDQWSFEEKEVEIEAIGVTAKPIRAFVLFPGDDAEISLRYVKFPFAVRVDRPFRYRVRSYRIDGEEHVSEWTTRSVWGAPLNVTGDLEAKGSES